MIEERVIRRNGIEMKRVRVETTYVLSFARIYPIGTDREL